MKKIPKYISIIIKRLDEYKMSDFLKYCQSTNKKDVYKPGNLFYYRVYIQDFYLNQWVNTIGCNTKIIINGSVSLSDREHRVVPLVINLKDGVDKMLTKDATDFILAYNSKDNCYWLQVKQSMGINKFTFRFLENDQNGTPN